MASVEENWQTTKPAIRERCKFMFNNELLSDVKFVVSESSSESESKKVIPAHKFVLSIGSPVFFAMFYGKMAETKDSIELPDCDYEGLLELFRYMYSDEVHLNGSNVMQVLRLANRYRVPSLSNKCTKYLRENLVPSNAFCIMLKAQSIGENNLVEECWKVIDKDTDKALKSDEFVTLEKCLVKAIVKRDSLNVTEVELFKAVNRWVTREIETQNLTPDGAVKRRILGEELVKAIRFPLMSFEEFTSCVIDCNILTEEEAIGMIKHFADLTSPQVQFIQTRRTGVTLRCYRFQKCSPPKVNWEYSGKIDSIRFSVDKAIYLLGLHLFGRKNGGYKVRIGVKRATDNFSLVEKSGSFSSVKDDTDAHYGFDLLFDGPIQLKKGEVYDVEAVIKGPLSWYGQEGRDSAECFGVTFTFHNSDSSRNGTDVQRGQFSAFIFR